MANLLGLVSRLRRARCGRFCSEAASIPHRAAAIPPGEGFLTVQVQGVLATDFVCIDTLLGHWL